MTDIVPTPQTPHQLAVQLRKLQQAIAAETVTRFQKQKFLSRNPEKIPNPLITNKLQPGMNPE